MSFHTFRLFMVMFATVFLKYFFFHLFTYFKYFTHEMPCERNHIRSKAKPQENPCFSPHKIQNIHGFSRAITESTLQLIKLKC